MTADKSDVTASRPNLLGTRREVLIGAGGLLASGAALARKPHHQIEFLHGAKIEALVPKEFAGWRFVAASGLVLPPQDQLQDKLYTQLLTRTYANAAGAQMMLLIAYNASQDGIVQVHRPEICYPASGYRLTSIAEHLVPLAPHVDVPSRYIVAETGLRREEIIYWTRLGSYFPRRWSDQRWAVFVQNLGGDIPDGLLVRISSVMPETGAAALDAFARDFYASVGTQMQRVLVGNRAGTLE
ncbi:MAG: methanolan biosynthesis EpsI [Bradyrhizobium sp.]|nr:methanolan biosynthesis EpsI [Bradyrhizobium sp.]